MRAWTRPRSADCYQYIPLRLRLFEFNRYTAEREKGNGCRGCGQAAEWMTESVTETRAHLANNSLTRQLSLQRLVTTSLISLSTRRPNILRALYLLNHFDTRYRWIYLLYISFPFLSHCPLFLLFFRNPSLSPLYPHTSSFLLRTTNATLHSVAAFKSLVKSTDLSSFCILAIVHELTVCTVCTGCTVPCLQWRYLLVHRLDILKLWLLSLINFLFNLHFNSTVKFSNKKS